jgi:polyferredoxin
LQDLLFRLNRNQKDTAGIIRQHKIPFAVSNAIRVAFFVAFVGVAFAWSFDFIGVVDPFKVFNPAHLGILGAITVGLILASSFFVYRPWCHLACPFGLTGWLLERFSRVKIRVNEDTCTKCLSCAKACPSDAMEAIVLKRKVLPDCFSCGTCMDVCPSKSISFGPRPKG